MPWKMKLEFGLWTLALMGEVIDLADEAGIRSDHHAGRTRAPYGQIPVRQPLVPVVDGHPVRKAKLVREYVAKQEGRWRLIPLPPYSPRLDPGEQARRYVKTRVARQLPATKMELKRLVLAALYRLKKLPANVASLFRHPDRQYVVT